MSRIIKSLIQSTKEKTSLNLICCLNKRISILDTNLKFFALEDYAWDTNKELLRITPEQISTNLSLTFDGCICNTFIQYNNALNLSRQLRIPIINIFLEKEPIKKEGIFSAAQRELSQDLNIIKSKELAKELYIMNYELPEPDLNKQIIRMVNNWTP